MSLLAESSLGVSLGDDRDEEDALMLVAIAGVTTTATWSEDAARPASQRIEHLMGPKVGLQIGSEEKNTVTMSVHV